MQSERNPTRGETHASSYATHGPSDGVSVTLDSRERDKLLHLAGYMLEAPAASIKEGLGDDPAAFWHCADFLGCALAWIEALGYGQPDRDEYTVIVDAWRTKRLERQLWEARDALAYERKTLPHVEAGDPDYLFPGRSHTESVADARRQLIRCEDEVSILAGILGRL